MIKHFLRFFIFDYVQSISLKKNEKYSAVQTNFNSLLKRTKIVTLFTFNHRLTYTVHPILLMEYLPCGDLLGFLRKSRGIVDRYYNGEGEVAKLKTYDLVSFSNQIATGMVFLASKGVCESSN